MLLGNTHLGQAYSTCPWKSSAPGTLMCAMGTDSTSPGALEGMGAVGGWLRAGWQCGAVGAAGPSMRAPGWVLTLLTCAPPVADARIAS